jgi:hypothetical protein
MPENSTWAITGWIIAGLGFLGIIIRSIGPWRKQINDVEERLRTELHAEIKDLRERAKDERDAHALEMRAFNRERDEMADRLALMEKKLIRQQLRHNAERALARHQLSNITQCFDAVVLLIETNPEKSPEIIAKIKEMRAVQIVAEAEEKAAIRAAEIAFDDGETDHDGN